MKLIRIILSYVVVFILFSCSISKRTLAKTNSIPNNQQSIIIKGDTTRNGIRPYNEIITDKAITQIGLIKIHKVAERYYFELADSILSKDMLIVNRISKGAATYYGYGGDYIGENVIQFVKGPGQKIFIKRSSYLDISYDSSENGMYRSVLNSNLLPIVASFDIKAFSKDSMGIVIDITDYLNGENDIFFFNAGIKKNYYKLGAIQSDKSFIQSINSFPLNTEIKTIKTYTVDDRFLTFELNSSIVLLPQTSMKPRYFDPRVGYFSRGYLDFDASQGVDRDYMITRWRLEPKKEDVEKYKKGELVEPEKPIVYYIDPATPKKWVPYLIKGVNAWQKAFEKAGFKHAIYALEAPINDSSWSLEDARHNAIIYKASAIQNANGPQISDPRSGEILESHINWYHNVQQVLHDWYFIQASPNDINGRRMEFNDSLMGQLIQYVCAHEVGHTLGLMHNFRASSSIPVDSLRSKRYVSENSHTPSIMDYARFNYVAQPEDSIPEKDLIPHVGVYDEWAIEWGYTWLPDLKTKEKENDYLKKWIVQKQLNDKRLLFGSEKQLEYEARNNIEDLGDDPIKASYYGIKNLKFVMSHLSEWTKTANKDYGDLARLNDALINQYALYILHVLKYVGGEYEDQKTGDQDGYVWSFVNKQMQQSAMKFLHEQLFDTPEWLFNKQVYGLTGSINQLTVAKIQALTINKLDYMGFFNKKLYAQLILPAEQSYSYSDVLTNLEDGVWKELKNHEKINFSRRMLQKAYIDNLAFYIRFLKGTEYDEAGYCTILNDHITRLYKKVNDALPGYSDRDSQLHLEAVRDWLKLTLDIQKKEFMGQNPYNHLKADKNNDSDHGFLNDCMQAADFFPPNLRIIERNCWNNINWKDWER